MSCERKRSMKEALLPAEVALKTCRREQDRYARSSLVSLMRKSALQGNLDLPVSSHIQSRPSPRLTLDT